MVLSVSDHVHKYTGVLPVRLSSSLSIGRMVNVWEGGTAVLTVDYIDGQFYDVVKSPNNGQILMDGIQPSRFTRSDLENGWVEYVHTGGEIGRKPQIDSLVLSTNVRGSPTVVEVRFVIHPVDNTAPELVVSGPLLVSDRVVAVPITYDIMSAMDLDTTEEKLTFVIAETPSRGQVERSRSYRSERSSTRNAISSFTNSELREGLIQYVQSNLSQRGPDSFLVFVTDGKQNSSSSQVEIKLIQSATADDLELIVDDVYVKEGSEAELNVNRLLPTSPDSVLSLTAEPAHGEVILVMSAHQNGGIRDVRLQEVVMSDMSQGLQIVYRHDGSETQHDEFRLSLSDGTHAVGKTVRVFVTSVNDGRPELVRNNILRTDSSRTGLITASLLKAVDDDSTNDEIRYIIVAQPARGNLVHKNVTVIASGSKGERFTLTTLGKGDSFTQADVNSNRIEYVEMADGDVTRDSFIFQLTDGTNFVSHETFEIEMSSRIAASERLVMSDGGMRVRVNTTTALTGLNCSSSVALPEHVVYTITVQPLYGNVVSWSNHAFPTFSQFDINEGAVFYSQTIQTNDTDDGFHFAVTDNTSWSDGRFRIEIDHGSALQGKLVTLAVNVPLTVIHGYKAVLTATNLLISADSEVSRKQLIYSIVEPPRHGWIMRQGAVVRRFSQSDIDGGLVEYKSESIDDAMMDYFLFTTSIHYDVMDNVTAATTPDRKPSFFSVLIQPISKIPPTVVKNISPYKLETLGRDKYGFVLTGEHLKTIHPLFESRDIVYHIKVKAQYGYLEHLGSHRLIKRKFTQKDLDDERIGFVLNEQTRAISDFFTFRVLDQNRNAVDDQRYFCSYISLCLSFFLSFFPSFFLSLFFLSLSLSLSLSFFRFFFLASFLPSFLPFLFCMYSFVFSCHLFIAGLSFLFV